LAGQPYDISFRREAPVHDTSCEERRLKVQKTNGVIALEQLYVNWLH
jgi:hypothetical protein